MALRSSISISDFVKLRTRNAYYVDKTAFITQFLASPVEAVLLPRPRRFGKTLNMSTLCTFLERSAIDRAPLFEGLEVWGSAEAREHFQRYPVIFLTFKGVKASSWPEMHGLIRELLSREFLRHAYLAEPGRLHPSVARDFERVTDRQDDLPLYSAALRNLSALLHAHHGEQVVILIDEYDVPIQAAYAGGFYDEAITFFRNFLTEGLKDNPHLFKAAMTGVLRVAKESIFSGLNNVAVRSVFSDHYATAFGFTEAEVQKLAADMGAPEVADELRQWYDGYRIGGQAIYNPWSVMSYVDERSRGFVPHWVNTGSDDVLRTLVLEKGRALTSDLETLLKGESLRKVVSEHVVLRDLDGSSTAVWSLLLMSGYLTARSHETVEGQTHAELAIPNREVRVAFTTGVMQWLESGLADESNPPELLSKAMLDGRETDLTKLLTTLVVQTLSYHDTGRRQPERVYQAFVLGMLVHLAKDWDVRSNRESGLGRYDVAVIPRTPGKPGVILEFKALDEQDGETVEQALESALKQIEERQYARELEAAGAAPIQRYGVVFDGKRVWVRKG